jgi:hypothetical protein
MGMQRTQSNAIIGSQLEHGSLVAHVPEVFDKRVL